MVSRPIASMRRRRGRNAPCRRCQVAGTISGFARSRRVGSSLAGMRGTYAKAAVLSCLLLPALAAEPFLCTFVSKDGKPLGDVEVRLRVADREQASDMPPLYRKSDKQGVAAFPELLPGRYVVDAQLRNHAPIKQFVTAGQDFSVRRTLLRKNEFQRIEQKALKDLDAAEFLDAVRGVEALLDHYPEDAFLHDTLARAYAGLDEEAKALEEARIAAALDPERFGGADLRVRRMVLQNRGEQALQAFDLAAARDAFESLTEVAPDDPVAYEGLALTYGHLGRIDQALRAIESAIELDSENPQLHEIKRVLEDSAGGP